MGELGIQQRHDMTPRRKGARFLIHPMFARQLAYQLSRNKVAKLMQYTQLVRGWFCPFGFSSFLSFHRWFLNRNHRLTTRPTFFSATCGTLVDINKHFVIESKENSSHFRYFSAGYEPWGSFATNEWPSYAKATEDVQRMADE